MAEQILDQIRDVAEGQIVCFFSHPLLALLAYPVRKHELADRPSS